MSAVKRMLADWFIDAHTNLYDIILYKLLYVIFKNQNQHTSHSQHCPFMQVEEFEVEEILQVRTTIRNTSQYKVKWKGYSMGEATWEPSENLQGCLQLISKFHDKQKQTNIDKSPPRPKKEAKQAKPSKEAKRPKTAQQNTNNSPTDYLQIYRRDLYFSDESEEARDKQIDPVNSQYQSNPILPPSQSQQYLEANSPIQKPISSIFRQSRQSASEKKKQDRKKKTKETEESSQDSHQWLSRKDKDASIPVEHIPQRNLDQQLATQPIKRAKIVRKESVCRKNVWTQTQAFPQLTTDIHIVAMHASIDALDKDSPVWFSLKEGNRYFEMRKEKLMMDDPRVLYNFYHAQYLQSKAKTQRLQAFINDILSKRCSGGMQEEEESDDEEILEAFTIDLDLDDPADCKLIERTIRKTLQDVKKSKKKFTNI